MILTPDEHNQRIRQIAFMLEKADYGMGMPRDYQRVLELRVMLEQARKEAEAELMDSDFNEQAGGY